MKIANLIARVLALRCLPLFQKNLVVAALRKLGHEDKQRYLTQRLEPIERYVEPVYDNHPAFRAVCDQFANKTPHAIAAAWKFPVVGDFSCEVWWKMTCVPRIQLDPPKCLFAMVQHLTLPIDLDRPTFEASALPLVGNSLRSLNAPRAAVAWLEAWLGLPDHAFSNAATLKTELSASRQLRDVDRVRQANYVMTLAEALRPIPNRGDRQATWLLEAWLGLPDHAFSNAATLKTELSANLQLRDLGGVGQANYVWVLANALRFIPERGAQQAAWLLEAWLGLPGDAFDDAATLASRLSASQLLQEDIPRVVQANYVAALANALRLIPERGAQHAAWLLEAWLDHVPEDFARAPKWDAMVPTIVLQFMRTWVAFSTEDARVIDVMDSMVEYFRTVRDDVFGSDEQRRDFADQNLGHFQEFEKWAELWSDRARDAGDFARADQIELMQLHWHEVLDNRHLLEDVEDEAFSQQNSAELPGQRWPYSDQSAWSQDKLEAWDAQHWSNWFERGGMAPGCGGGDGLRLALALPLESRPIERARPPLARPLDDVMPRQTEVDTGRSTRPPRRREKLREQLRERPDFLQLLPENAVLLRVTVPQSLDGNSAEVVVRAVRRAGGEVKVLATSKSAADGGYRLRMAAFAFDLAVERVWAHAHSRGGALLSSSLRSVLRNLADIEALARLRDTDRGVFEVRLTEIGSILLGLRGRNGVVTSDACQMSDSDQTAGEPPAATTMPGDDGRLNRFTKLGLTLLQHLAEDMPVDQVRELAAVFGAALEPIKAWTASECESDHSLELTRRRQLDAAGEQFLQAAAEIIDLSPIWEATKGRIDWSKTDVLLQLNGPTWNVPFAWLPFGDRGLGEQPANDGDEDATVTQTRQAGSLPHDGRPRLFEQVASTSSVLSLTLHKFHSDETDWSDKLPERIVSAHWIKPSERSEFPGPAGIHRYLHDLCGSEADYPDWSLVGLGDAPEATSENVQAAISSSTQRAAAILCAGHGGEIPLPRTASSIPRGLDGLPRSPEEVAAMRQRERHFSPMVMQFADGPWRGDAHYDSDFLFLMACIIGRLNQTNGERDVRGFIATLAAHDCRCAIAANRPIANTEAALFAGTFFREYLAALRENGGRSHLFLKARVFNRTLRFLTADKQRAVTPHLMQAFDLYGVG